MTKVKLILAGITGAIGLTSAAIVPSLMKSHEKVESGPKAVSKAWSKNTNKDTSFKNFGGAFAPFLLDINKTSDEVWDERSQQTQRQGWSALDRGTRISTIKNACRSFHDAPFTSQNASNPGEMMDLCGIYDSQGKKPVFASPKNQDLTKVSELTAGKVCGLLVGDSDIVKGECGKIGVTPPSTASS